MIATFLLGFFSVLSAFLAKYRTTQWGLKVSFTLIFIFLALRYNFGNDYKGYLIFFQDINKYERVDYFDPSQRIEIGWIFINRLFRPLGFFTMTAVLALFNCIIYYRFIKKYVPVSQYWFAVFLYIFTTGFMLIHASAMRQSVAIALFIFSLNFLYKKNLILYFLCIGLASFFHNSALILIPIYLLSFINWKINKFTSFIVISIFISLFLFLSILTPYLNLFISSYFDRYGSYEGAVVVGSGIGVLFLVILFLLVLKYEKFQQKETALIFKLALISFMFIPLGLFIQLIGRIGMYFGPATIVAYPVILRSLKKPIYKFVFVVSIVLFTTYTFFQFFNSELWHEAFGTYNTIFSAENFF